MRKDQVPQDSLLLEGQQQVCYAADEEGRYVLAPSAGWEPANIVNVQAWEVIREQLEQVFAEVRAGRQSPLAYHMTRHQMDPGLLGAYVGMARWRVRRHLRPAVFARLAPKLLERYATALELSVAELQSIPAQLELAMPRLAEPSAPEKESP